MPSVPVVDDAEEILQAVRSVAEKMGYAVSTLRDPEKFAEVFSSFRPDVVALDVVMPGADGVQITQWLIGAAFTGHLIIMSGYPNYYRMVEELAVWKGKMTISTLAKPFTNAELRDALSAIRA